MRFPRRVHEEPIIEMLELHRFLTYISEYAELVNKKEVDEQAIYDLYLNMDTEFPDSWLTWFATLGFAIPRLHEEDRKDGITV